MVWPLVEPWIEPFVMDQAQVVAAGPEAELPATFAQTVAGLGVMVGTAGAALIGTSRLFDAGQLLELVTVRFSVTFPLAPAVYVIVWMFVALVIVPFVI